MGLAIAVVARQRFLDLPQDRWLVESRPHFTSETSLVSGGAALAVLAASRCSACTRELEGGSVIRSGALYCGFECAQSSPLVAMATIGQRSSDTGRLASRLGGKR